MTDRPTTVPDVLTAAADVIEQRGWLQGSFSIRAYDEYGEPDGFIENAPVCVRGAISLAAAAGYLDETTELTDECVERLARHLDAEHATATGARIAVAVWNDAPGRTADEVVTALRATAEEARS